MISNRDKRFFNTASQLAEYATYERYKVGCVVVYHNKIISTGFNKDRTDPLQKKYNNQRNIPDSYPHKVHAEVDAIKHIIDLDIEWKNVSIYIYRKLKDRPFGLARPCKSCMKLIKDLGIKDVFYTTDEGYVYECIE